MTHCHLDALTRKVLLAGSQRALIGPGLVIATARLRDILGEVITALKEDEESGAGCSSDLGALLCPVHTKPQNRPGDVSGGRVATHGSSPPTASFGTISYWPGLPIQSPTSTGPIWTATRAVFT
jgi:hypothetical protein